MQTGLEDQLGLYQKRIPIFTRSVKGRFRRFKTSVLVLAYAIYFLLPWMPWSRLDAPAQAVLFDLPGRRFLIFGLTVYPQDVIWLALLLFIAAILLFFVTGLVGRAFCGYVCPMGAIVEWASPKHRRHGLTTGARERWRRVPTFVLLISAGMLLFASGAYLVKRL